MTDELRSEDHVLAQRLARDSRKDAPNPAATKAVGERAGFITPGVSALYDTQPSERKALELALKTASSITICGIAPKSLSDAIQRLAQKANASNNPLPWRKITYITPAPNIILSYQGHNRLGSVVQKWQSGLRSIRDCVRQLISTTNEDNDDAVKLALLGSAELFLEVVLFIKDQETGHERVWVSIGPTPGREETLFLVFDDETEFFQRLRSTVDLLNRHSQPLVGRQLEVDPEDLQEAVEACDPPEIPPLRVRSLQPVGTPAISPSCLPAAITVLRSAAAGRPITLLKRRTRFTDTDDFDKLSLLSARLLEDDLAAALSIPMHPERNPSDALDAMWKSYGGRPEPLLIPLKSFLHAAQRDVFITCGLDLPDDRFTYRGCQLIEREHSGHFLFFGVFEVVLFRSRDEDEVELAEAWNPVQLERVYQDLLYSPTYRPELNRLLLQRQQWLEATVFSQPLQQLRRTQETQWSISVNDRAARGDPA